MRGIFGMPMAGVKAGGMQQQMPEQKPARWMDGGKFGVKDGIGVALGLLGTAFGGRPILAEALMGNMMQKRRAEQEAMAAERDRMARREDLQWEWQNKPKEAPNNDTVADYEFIAQKLGPDVANQFLSGIGDPVVTVPLPGGLVYSGPRSGLAQALGGAAPTKPKGKLTPLGSQGAPQGGLTDEQASAVMMQAARTGMLSATDAAALGSVLGTNGDSAFNQWMRENNIRIGN